MCMVKVLFQTCMNTIENFGQHQDVDVMDKDVRHMLFCTKECRGALRGVELDTSLALRYCDTQVPPRVNFQFKILD